MYNLQRLPRLLLSTYNHITTQATELYDKHFSVYRSSAKLCCNYFVVYITSYIYALLFSKTFMFRIILRTVTKNHRHILPLSLLTVYFHSSEVVVFIPSSIIICLVFAAFLSFSVKIVITVFSVVA